jgi:hypothetical protein
MYIFFILLKVITTSYRVGTYPTTCNGYIPRTLVKVIYFSKLVGNRRYSISNNM